MTKGKYLPIVAERCRKSPITSESLRWAKGVNSDGTVYDYDKCIDPTPGAEKYEAVYEPSAFVFFVVETVVE